MAKERTRRTRIETAYMEAKPQWAAPTVIFRQYKDNEIVEVILTVRDPWDLASLRRELDKISAYWKEKAGL